MPAPQYVHPQFRYRSPKQRFWRGLWLALACLGMAAIGAAMMAPFGPRKSDAAMAPGVQVSHAETMTASPVGYAAVDQQPASDAQVVAQKPFCLGPSGSDGSCVSFQLPKVRMVRVPRASILGQHSNSGKPGVAANSRATGLDKGIAETSKAQRSAHRQNQRRNQPLHSRPSRGDVRVADWAARGYASTWRSDQGRQGFAGNFW